MIMLLDVYSFIIDFLPATRTRHHDNRFPPVRRGDDEMAMDTQAGGNMLGGPVYSNGGHDGIKHGNGDASSYGSQQPMAQNAGRYYPPQEPPMRNF